MVIYLKKAREEIQLRHGSLDKDPTTRLYIIVGAIEEAANAIVREIRGGQL